MTRPSSRSRWWSKITRDVILFAVGLALTIHEGLKDPPHDPSLLVLYAGMMGLPAIFRFDEIRRRDNGRKKDRES